MGTGSENVSVKQRPLGGGTRNRVASLQTVVRHRLEYWMGTYGSVEERWRLLVSVWRES